MRARGKKKIEDMRDVQIYKNAETKGRKYIVSIE